MTSIYELTQDLLDLAAIMEALSECEMTPEAQAQIDAHFGSLPGEVEQKLVNCAQLVMHWESQQVSIDAELNRLKKRKSVVENSAARLKERMLTLQQAYGKDKIGAGLCTLRINKPRKSVDPGPIDLLPDAYKRTKPATEEPDKKAIKRALDAGETVGRARLVAGEPTISIL